MSPDINPYRQRIPDLQTDTEKFPLVTEAQQRILRQLIDIRQNKIEISGEPVAPRILPELISGRKKKCILWGLGGIGKTTITHIFKNVCLQAGQQYGISGVDTISYGECLAEAEEVLGSRFSSDTDSKILRATASELFYKRIKIWEASGSPHVLLANGPFVSGIAEASDIHVDVIDRLAHEDDGTGIFGAVFGDPKISERRREMQTNMTTRPPELLQQAYEENFDMEFYGLEHITSPHERGMAIIDTLKKSADPERMKQLEKWYREATENWLVDKKDKKARVRQLAKVALFEALEPTNYKIILQEVVREEDRMNYWGLKPDQTLIIVNRFVPGKVPFFIAT